MRKTWKKVPLAEAQIHPLYGVKNWLIVFAIGPILGGLLDLGALSGEAHKAGLTIWELLANESPVISFFLISLWIRAGLVSVIYWALFEKHPNFRLIASSLLLASGPITVLVGAIYPFDGLGQVLAVSLFPWVISCGIWVTYLNRSKRVRVTFDNEILVESPDAASLRADLEEALWAIALEEVEGGGRMQGLWAKAYASCNGNEAAAKAAYMRDRVKQLASEAIAREVGERTSRR